MAYRLVSVALLIILGGCGSLVQAHGTCSDMNPSYLATWNCIRGRIAANQAGAMNNDLGVRYVAVGDAIAERVRHGQLTDAEAKLLLAQELARANAEFQARSAHAFDNMAAGLAAAALLQPPPAPAITCTTTSLGGFATTRCQ